MQQHVHLDITLKMLDIAVSELGFVGCGCWLLY